ncbi:hypothetical protein BMF94_4120 [Rhodotorula taiwanensis]|uniref:Uncharacterized protein n=1 Tax=Rhodotorula taiwanensis TaxID=741276 RepID=A0A2S5B7Y1_9BASI|nr:hypothetical protein BMF94_4120 [Rhodotorula taiwanensis]
MRPHHRLDLCQPGPVCPARRPVDVPSYARIRHRRPLPGHRPEPPRFGFVPPSRRGVVPERDHDRRLEAEGDVPRSERVARGDGGQEPTWVLSRRRDRRHQAVQPRAAHPRLLWPKRHPASAPPPPHAPRLARPLPALSQPRHPPDVPRPEFSPRAQFEERVPRCGRKDVGDGARRRAREGTERVGAAACGGTRGSQRRRRGASRRGARPTGRTGSARRRQGRRGPVTLHRAERPGRATRPRSSRVSPARPRRDPERRRHARQDEVDRQHRV